MAQVVMLAFATNLPLGLILGATLLTAALIEEIVKTVGIVVLALATGSRVTLDAPGIRGLFALGQGALLAGGARDLLAEVRLEGVGEGTAQRMPVALAVVLDHSGSMSGEKMVQAREGVVSLLERMHDDDYLSVVVYDDSAEVLQPLARVSEIRRSLPPRLRQVEARGGTIIPQAMAMGATALASAPGTHVRRVVLVSDGQDGSGLTLDQIQSELGRRANDRITTSSLGVGTDYSEPFMTGVADAGRGNYAFLRQGEELQGFLTRELEESGATVAENVVATVSLPPGVHFVSSHGAMATTLSDRIELPVGTVFAGERRKVVLALRVDAGVAGTASAIAASVRFERASDHAPQASRGEVAVRYVATEAEAVASIDDEIHPDALAAVVDARQQQAVLAWQNGDREQAIHLAQANQAAYEEANRQRPSAVYQARVDEIDGDVESFRNVEAASESGRSWGLAGGAMRRARSEAY
ncbi:MAG: VWA domain-containing protein, partial [Deltaproteobacteria bacterium]|nr:VWA domain-containing protein [Deltaproteobacteria bacterium]